MKDTKVICDSCQKNITKAGPMPAFRLHLQAEELPQSGFSYAVIIYPPIEDDLYFCGIACLAAWVKTRT